MDMIPSFFSQYFPIQKVDDEQRMVWGYASTAALDLDGEVIKLEAIKSALPDYMLWGNIREMHQPSAVGVAAHTEMREKGLWLGAHVSDDSAWKKCKPTILDDGTILPPVYKGFSIGGQVTRKVGKNIEALTLIEISLVDRPANPECRIEMVKSTQVLSGNEATLIKNIQTDYLNITSEDIPDVGNFTKLMRKFGLKLNLVKTDIIDHTAHHPSGSAINVLDHPATDHGLLPDVPAHMPDDPGDPSVGSLKDEYRRHLQPLTSDAPKKPFGDIKYADTGLLKDGGHRFPIDNEYNVRRSWEAINDPEHAAKYSSDQVISIQEQIADAWCNHIDSDGPPSTNKTSKMSPDVLASLGEIARTVTEDKPGVQQMADNDEVAKRASRAMMEHIDRAGHHVDKAIECHKNAMIACAALAGIYKEADGDAAKAAGAAVNAADQVVKLNKTLDQMRDHHDIASSYIGKVAGNVHDGQAKDWTTTRVNAVDPSSAKTAEPEVMKTFSKAEVDLMVKNAALEAQLLIMKSTPANARRGVAFDQHAALIAQTPSDKQTVLMNNVSVDRENPDSVTKGVARMIGNMIGRPDLFAKSMTDPSFHGAAG